MAILSAGGAVPAVPLICGLAYPATSASQGGSNRQGDRSCCSTVRSGPAPANPARDLAVDALGAVTWCPLGQPHGEGQPAAVAVEPVLRGAEPGRRIRDVEQAVVGRAG